MPTTVSTAEVKKAAVELALMKRSLSKWLRYRAINDARGVAVVRGSSEQNLANRLYALLSAMFPSASLPAADLSVNPQGAVQLANIALTGQVPVPPSTPAGPPSSSTAALSGLFSGGAAGATHPWLWPVLIVGGLLVVVLVSITSAANLAAQQEQDACIEAGACTDYGFWLKWLGIAAAGYFAWTKLGVGDSVRGFLKKGGS